MILLQGKMMTRKEFGKKIDSKFSFYLIIVMGILSLIFLDEQIVKNNELLTLYADTMSNIFHGFEQFALKSQYADLYYFAKFQLALSLIPTLIIFIIYLNIIRKIYKCSWGDLSYNKDYYFSEEINKQGFFY